MADGNEERTMAGGALLSSSLASIKSRTAGVQPGSSHAPLHWLGQYASTGVSQYGPPWPSCRQHARGSCCQLHSGDGSTQRMPAAPLQHCTGQGRML